MLCAPQRFDAKGEVVDALLAPAQLVAFTDEDGFNTDLGEGVRGLHEAIARGAEKALIEGVDAVGDVVKGGGDEFGGGGRCRGAEVGDEVCDGEVGLVSNGRDDGEFRVEDGIGKEFGVEGGEVFERTAAAGDDDDVDGAAAVEVRDAGGDFGGSGFALDERGVEQDVKAGVAAIDDVDKVADNGAGGRGDDADAVGKGGEWLLAVGMEEATRFETLLELFESDLERAGADRLEKFGDELHLAALFVDRNFAAEEDMKAVGELEAEERGLLTEEDRGELGIAIFKREVDVAGGRRAEVGDFAFDPEVAVFALDVEAHVADEVADFPDMAGHGRGSRCLKR